MTANVLHAEFRNTVLKRLDGCDASFIAVAGQAQLASALLVGIASLWARCEGDVALRKKALAVDRAKHAAQNIAM